MFVFGNLLLAVATILDVVFSVYKWIVIIAAVISWVNPSPYNPIVRFLYSVTEPVFRPIRRIIGLRLGPIDISPLVVILVIIFIQKFPILYLKFYLSKIIESFIEFGYKLKGG